MSPPPFPHILRVWLPFLTASPRCKGPECSTRRTLATSQRARGHVAVLRRSAVLVSLPGFIKRQLERVDEKWRGMNQVHGFKAGIPRIFLTRLSPYRLPLFPLPDLSSYRRFQNIFETEYGTHRS